MATTPLYDKTTPDTSRGLTAVLWRQSLEAYTSNDPSYGYRIKDDFAGGLVINAGTALTGTTAVTSDGRWTAQDSGAAGGTYTASIQGAPDGIARIANGTTTTDFGIEFAWAGSSVTLPSATSSANRRGRVVFETRFAANASDVLWAGLTSVAATANAMGASGNLVADSGYIAIMQQNDGSLHLMCKSAASGTASDTVILAASAYTTTGAHKWGFAVNDQPGGASPTGNAVSIDIVIDGVWYNSVAKTFLANSMASLPTGFLSPRFYATSGDSAAVASTDIDSIDVFVANNS